MLEEEIVNSSLGYIKSHYPEIDYDDKELKRDLKEIVFQEIMSLINEKQAYMLNIEKAIVPSFISQNFIDIYEILKNLLENEI